MSRPRASGTARLIAAAAILAANTPRLRPLVPARAEELSRLFLSTSRTDRVLRAAVSNAAGRAVCLGLERALARGVIRHWMLRKKWIESRARESIEQGFGQVIVIGAGMDTLAFRLSEHRACGPIFLADHPSTQAVLRRALSVHPSLADSVHMVPIDLQTDDPADALGRNPAFRARPTLVIIEGVLMYVRDRRVPILFDQLASLPCPDLRLIATCMDTPPGAPIRLRPQSGLVTAWLAMRNERMHWSLPLAKLPGFLTAHGFVLRGAVTAAELSASDDAGAHACEGENLFVAERAPHPA